ncbi:OmpW/AlkL family protein [Phaeobacter marinintestinus]|uniref:OmpW/AlkL family protein n=1 Tax=Falsiphaeobacter marinintestinus TaxID=1492905 RepID=UPI0011B69BE2|nr:OmpW family outer membrane protein [Phaeobacter marinintestinus]
MKHLIATLALTTALGAIAAPLAAQSQGDWTFGIGVGWVNPKSTSATVAGLPLSVDEDVRPTFTVEYFFRDNLGIELLAATPFQHDISLGGTNIASTKHLPPTLSLNYHFPTQTKFKPFVGIGVNYTTFFDEQTSLGTLNLSDSWGVALHAGADYQVSQNGSLRFDVRWIDINTDATLNGVALADVEIDPFIVGFSYIHRF